MTAPARLAAFAAVLALVFAGAVAAGGAIGPDSGASAGDKESAGEPAGADGHSGMTETTEAETQTAAHGAEQAAHPVRGLAVAENGLRLVVDDPELARGRRERLTFSIVDDGGRTVRDFDVEHERRMHLILARRDLANFQHLHPEQADDGSWTTDVEIGDPGSYRMFADFTHDGEPVTLATDLRVDGAARLRGLPAPEPTATSDGGYEVRLDGGRARPGQEATLRFTVTRDGRAVHTQPYLGAGGHLVALRDGDLAFLHVHPVEDADTAHAGENVETGSIAFAATFPTTGRYRLFLQFKVVDRVETVAFTQEVS